MRSAGTERPVTLQRLSNARGDVRRLQAVLEAAPAYAKIVTGGPPQPGDAAELVAELPPGKEAADKWVLAILLDGETIGAADVVSGYPDERTAFIGLLVLGEGHQGRGLGTAAYRELERLVASWPGCRRVRLGVVRGNGRALRFWERQGFSPTGETKPYRSGPIETDVLLMEKELAPAGA